MQASTLGSAPTDTALLISQEGVTFGQFGHRIICHGEISIHKRKEKKKAYKTDSSEEDFSHQYQHEPRELCAEQVSLALQGQRQISSQQFHLNSQLTTPKQESMVLSTPSSLLARTFHSRPWLDAVPEHQDSDVIEGGMFPCTLWVVARQSLPGLWILCKIHRWQTQPNPKSVLPSEIQARLLMGTSLINLFFYIYIYTKKMHPEHFPAHVPLQRHCLFSRLSVLEGSSHGCVQHKACSRLSPDQPSKDNQVRWSNGPPGP